MIIYSLTPGFKRRTFKLCVLNGWDSNFCICSSLLWAQSTAKGHIRAKTKLQPISLQVIHSTSHYTTSLFFSNHNSNSIQNFRTQTQNADPSVVPKQPSRLRDWWWWWWCCGGAAGLWALKTLIQLALHLLERNEKEAETPFLYEKEILKSETIITANHWSPKYIPSRGKTPFLRSPKRLF